MTFKSSNPIEGIERWELCAMLTTVVDILNPIEGIERLHLLNN